MYEAIIRLLIVLVYAFVIPGWKALPSTYEDESSMDEAPSPPRNKYVVPNPEKYDNNNNGDGAGGAGGAANGGDVRRSNNNSGPKKIMVQQPVAAGDVIEVEMSQGTKNQLKRKDRTTTA